ncbi:glucosaminidase domain-containing protein [Halolactibacillus sp. JCM 19043]|uniref:glucosaminidase domain-containing protein n=1 Tax=Halolactibacillus sp. JCM 19043 TaxID=1460638 RepID=UPI0007827F7C|nr:N-acetylglucosaminidase [Halolactibacillus sp. JCM 19043]
MEKDEVYPIDKDFGNWHQIKFDNYYGYVRKSSTVPADGSILKNQTNMSQRISEFTTLKNLEVYDNTSGKLVQYGTIKEGLTYGISNDYSNWWEISYAGRKGYVRKSDVNAAFPTKANYFKVKEDQVPVYDNRTGALIEVGTLEKDEVYPIDKDFGNWHQIKFDNYYGYVRKTSTAPADGLTLKNESSEDGRIREFVALKDLEVYDNTSGKLVQYGTIKEGKSYGVLSDYSNWWEITYAGRKGYVRKSDVRTDFIETDKYFKVSEENTPIYDNRSGSLVEVGVLIKGEVYPIDKHFGNWHRIKFDNYYGYIRRSSTEPANGNVLKNETEINQRTRLFVASKDLEVYDNTSGKLVQYATIKKGKSYGIVSDFSNWWEVALGGRKGYVRKADVNNYFTQSDNYFKTKQTTPVYDNRTGSLVKVGELAADQEYMRVEGFTDWHKIKFSDHFGYVRVSDTFPIKSIANNKLSEKKTINQVVIPEEDTLVYASNSKSADVIGKVLADTKYRLVSNPKNGWVEINYANRIAYLSVENVYPVTEYSKTLSQMIDIQINLSTRPQTDKYRNLPSYIHSSLVQEVEGHFISGDGVALRTEPSTAGGTSTVAMRVNSGTAVKYIRSVQGSLVSGDTTWYEIEYDSKRLFVHSSLLESSKGMRTINEAAIMAATKVNAHTYDVYPKNSTVVIKNTVKGDSINGNNTWYEVTLGSWRLPTRSDLEQYINPLKQNHLQFLDLTTVSGATTAELNKILSGKGVLNQQGAAFILAGKEHGVNEAYLVSHALLETGHGTSQLASGVVMGIDKNDNIVQQTNSNKGTLKNVKKVYNMYGIGAYDSCPLSCGAKYAYEKNWTEVDKAIIEGAAFVSNNFFARNQDTLYEMRWNPANPGTSQYATDIGWAEKQTSNIQKIYDSIQNPLIVYKMGRYLNQ